VKHVPAASRRPPSCHGRRSFRAMPRLALAAVAAIVVLSTISPAQAARVLVVQAGQSARLMKTLDAIRAKMAVPVDVVPLTGLDATTWNAALASGERPAVVIALGPRASDYVV